MELLSYPSQMFPWPWRCPVSVCPTWSPTRRLTFVTSAHWPHHRKIECNDDELADILSLIVLFDMYSLTGNEENLIQLTDAQSPWCGVWWWCHSKSANINCRRFDRCARTWPRLSPRAILPVRTGPSWSTITGPCKTPRAVSFAIIRTGKSDSWIWIAFSVWKNNTFLQILEESLLKHGNNHFYTADEKIIWTAHHANQDSVFSFIRANYIRPIHTNRMSKNCGMINFSVGLCGEEKWRIKVNSFCGRANKLANNKFSHKFCQKKNIGISRC